MRLETPAECRRMHRPWPQVYAVIQRIRREYLAKMMALPRPLVAPDHNPDAIEIEVILGRP